MKWTGRPSADFERLAWVLGVDVASLAEAIGHAWQRVCMDNADDPAPAPMEWFVAGEPAQVLMGVDRDKVLVAGTGCLVGRPVDTSDGPRAWRRGVAAAR